MTGDKDSAVLLGLCRRAKLFLPVQVKWILLFDTFFNGLLDEQLPTVPSALTHLNNSFHGVQSAHLISTQSVTPGADPIKLFTP